MLVASLPPVIRKPDKNGSQKSKLKKPARFDTALLKAIFVGGVKKCMKKPHGTSDVGVEGSCGLEVSPWVEKPDV